MFFPLLKNWNYVSISPVLGKLTCLIWLGEKEGNNISYFKCNYHKQSSRQFAILQSYGNQSSVICDRNVSHNILNSDPWFNALAIKPKCSFTEQHSFLRHIHALFGYLVAYESPPCCYTIIQLSMLMHKENCSLPITITVTFISTSNDSGTLICKHGWHWIW